MKKHLPVFITSLLIVLLSASSYTAAQEGDDCIKEEIRYTNTLYGNILYGQYGATSQLERESKFDKYKPENAFDNDMNTAWVEGKNDDGRGESLAFINSGKSEKIGILPGYGTVKHFKLNNRIKTASLEIYELAGRDAGQCVGMFYRKGKLLKTADLEFEDSMKIQYFSIGAIPGSAEEFIYVITIKSVYKGSKYNDTCIAEIICE